MKNPILRMAILVLVAVSLVAGSFLNARAQETITLKIEGVSGPEVKWLNETVKPAFEAKMKAEGKNVTVEVEEFTGTGQDLRQRYTLDIGAGVGGDILSFDGFWIPDFAEAGLLKPLKTVVGEEVMQWEGWAKTPAGLQAILAYKGEIYGYPRGTDVRVIWFRKDLLKQAGLPENWQPTSWEDILAAARQIKKALPEVTPLQLNAGKSMGEASTLQGYMMALLGAGHHIYDFENQKWIVRSKAILNTLNLYKTLFAEGLSEPRFQLTQDGRDQSFLAFKEGKVAMLVEGDFFWRSVLVPGGTTPASMADRDEKVAFAKMPAMMPGKGYNGQDFVTISGGTGYVINPNTKHAKEAWALMQVMFSKESFEALQALQPRIRPRTDVPVTGDAVMSALAAEVLPLTTVRPALPTYSKVSEQVQLMTEAIVTGDKTPEQAMEDYATAVEGIVGKENTVDLK